MSLNQAQAKAAAHYKGPCMVLAGPGSGKTLTIAKRIEYLIQKYKVRPEEILVITFTKYAANEMKQRYRSLAGSDAGAVTFGTFHGIYYGILKWAYGLNQANLLTEEEKYSLIKQAASQMEWEELPQADEERDYFKELVIEIGNVKNNCFDIKTYQSCRYHTGQFRQLYEAYEAMKRKLNKIDFEDMLIRCRELFLARPDILKKWQEKFCYILVDEFQDINQAQYEVVKMLAAPENNLFVVGDDDQSVYGFRGAKPGIMMEFQKDYPEAERILLDINYRSDAHVVQAALRVIGKNQVRFEKEIRPFKKPGETVHVQEVKDPVEESQYILEKIREYEAKGIAYTQMAVLYRTALDARTLSEVLSEHQIPFVMKEHVNNIYEHFIGIDISSYFHLSQGRMERQYLLQIANRPNRYIGRDSMSERRVSYETLRNFYCDKEWMMDRIDQLEWDMKMIRDKAPFAAIQYIRKSMGYDEFLKEYAAFRQIQAEELTAVLDEIQQNAKAYQSIEEWFGHVKRYKEQMERQRRTTAEDGIAMMTMHGAKGLEYDTVFIIQANEGSIPYKKAKSIDDIEEERRLFYVAMTRAKRKLIISYSKQKNGKDSGPSRFVRELFLV